MNSDLLKSKRVYKGFTQKDIAQKMGVSEKTYNQKELGKATFTINEVIVMTILLELNLNEINAIFFENNLPIVQV